MTLKKRWYGVFFFLTILPLMLLFSTSLIAGQAEEKDSYYRKLQTIWAHVKLDRDLDYWRAPERSPGPFLSKKPAAHDVWVSCDRWPDGSDMRRFGMDAIRLSRATTDHEKALAVYRWVRRWMIFNNRRGCSTERLNPDTIGHPWVMQGDKLLNVYGVHWCGGQARVVEQVWRALGYRAEKVIRGSHTIVGMHYQDYDGIARWHGLDVSHSAVAWHQSYKRLLSLDELSTKWYAFYYQYGLPGNGHLYFNDHRMELSFRRGEKLTRLWGNLGQPYQDNAARGKGMARKVPEYERGPYFPFTYGNGVWTYDVDPSQPGWEKGLAQDSVNMASGTLHPVKTGKPATAVWHFRTPYIISQANARIRFFRQTAHDLIRLYLSVDDGKTWTPVWTCPDDTVGSKEVVIPIGEKFAVSEKGPAPPKDFQSPFGRYTYRLKLELIAAGKPDSCNVDAIEFENTVQLNMYSLPQLQPGKNTILVRGGVEPGDALKITYVWDDPKGRDRRNVTVVEELPYEYEILAAGRQWEDCVCKSITVEAVPATGTGSHTLIREDTPAAVVGLKLSPVEETMGRWNGQPLQANMPDSKRVRGAVEDLNSFKRLLRGAVMLADPQTFEAFEQLAYNEKDSNYKHLAFVGMYLSDKEKARPVLLDILTDRTGSRVIWGKGKDKKDIGWGRELSWTTGGTVIGYIAAEAGWEEFVPGLLKILESGQCKSRWGPRYGTIRVIGRLGAGRKDATKAVRMVLENGYYKEAGDTLISAALAAGNLGDTLAIPALRKLLDRDYWPLKHNAALSLSRLGDTSIIPRMQQWLTTPFDENFRGYAADALGNLADTSSIDHLEKALSIEPFPWVRAKIQRALEKILIITDLGGLSVGIPKNPK